MEWFCKLPVANFLNSIFYHCPLGRASFTQGPFSYYQRLFTWWTFYFTCETKFTDITLTVLILGASQWRRLEIGVISLHRSRRHLSIYVEVSICLLVIFCLCLVNYFIRLHQITEMQAVVIDDSGVCRSICHAGGLCKMAEWIGIQVLFGVKSPGTQEN